MIETINKARYDSLRCALEQTAYSLGIGDCSKWGDSMLCFGVLYRTGAIVTPPHPNKRVAMGGEAG